MAQVDQLDKLEQLGFKKAHKKVTEKIDRSKKMHAAYQDYEFITPEDVKKFNELLKKKTLKDTTGYATYDKLAFIEVKDYTEAPPQEVLDKMGTAVDKGCFDTFEIAKIDSVKEVKDPILFGRVTGCGDRFFIAQWDDDVTLKMIREAVDGKKK